MNKSKLNYPLGLVNLLKNSVEELFKIYGNSSVKVETKNYSFQSSSRLINGVINFKNESMCGTLEIKASRRFLELTNPSVTKKSEINPADWLKELINLLMGNVKSHFALCNIKVTQDSPASSPNIPEQDNCMLRWATIPRICLKVSIKNSSCWLTLFVAMDSEINFEEKNDRDIFIGDPGDVVLFR